MNKFTIKKITAREILDSRGNPTVEAEVELEGGDRAVASVPSGASTGKFEALELRDGDKTRFHGKGVLKAVENINEEIAKQAKDKEFDQQGLDDFLIKLDGTQSKSRLGANAILGVSMAFARAAAAEGKMELYQYLGELTGNSEFAMPQPMLNIINGGKHADSGLDLQEFMLAPVGFPSLREKIRAGSEVIHTLKEILRAQGYTVSVGDEGGFAPKLSGNEQALDFMALAIEKSGYSTGQIKVAMDAAATSFYEGGKYNLKIAGEMKSLDSDEIIAWYEELVGKYPLVSIEDGLAEEDWRGFRAMNERLGKKIDLVGDDLLVTNVSRIEQAIRGKAVNAVLIKLNQIGTVSETIAAVELTKKQGWKPFVSHRSGETTDTFIADLAVGLACPLIKAGSLARGERVCKYNRLMEIEYAQSNH